MHWTTFTKNPFWKNHVKMTLAIVFGGVRATETRLQTIKYFEGGTKSHLIDMTLRSSFLHKSPLSPGTRCECLSSMLLKENDFVPHAPLKFDKSLFPSFTNGNYVSSLSSTTKVSSWTETFCLESFLTVRRKRLTLYSLYSSELLTPGMLHCHSIHSGGNWCHWLICHADQHIQHSGSNRHDVSSDLMPSSGPPPSLLRPLTEVFRVLTQTLAVVGTRGRAGAQ